MLSIVLKRLPLLKHHHFILPPLDNGGNLFGHSLDQYDQSTVDKLVHAMVTSALENVVVAEKAKYENVSKSSASTRAAMDKEYVKNCIASVDAIKALLSLLLKGDKLAAALEALESSRSQAIATARVALAPPVLGPQMQSSIPGAGAEQRCDDRPASAGPTRRRSTPGGGVTDSPDKGQVPASKRQASRTAARTSSGAHSSMTLEQVMAPTAPTVGGVAALAGMQQSTVQALEQQLAIAKGEATAAKEELKEMAIEAKTAADKIMDLVVQLAESKAQTTLEAKRAEAAEAELKGARGASSSTCPVCASKDAHIAMLNGLMKTMMDGVFQKQSS